VYSHNQRAPGCLCFYRKGKEFNTSQVQLDGVNGTNDTSKENKKESGSEPVQESSQSKEQKNEDCQNSNEQENKNGNQINIDELLNKILSDSEGTKSVSPEAAVTLVDKIIKECGEDFVNNILRQIEQNQTGNGAQ